MEEVGFDLFDIVAHLLWHMFQILMNALREPMIAVMDTPVSMETELLIVQVKQYFIFL